MELTGAQVLVKTLINQGIDTIFGYPGGAVLNIYDALYENKDKINHILTCHEQAASHAADGYARATGKIGVCLSTSGPGATNLVTGIATAYLDSVPILAITGNVATNLLGKDSFQEVNITDITKSITKRNYIVKDINKLQETIEEAIHIAQEGRPGPVLIDIPKDITAQKVEFKDRGKVWYTENEDIDTNNLKKVVDIINKSKKVFIYAGGGVKVSGASEELRNFAEKIGAPVATSLMAMDVIDNTHPLYTGMIGMHGTKASNLAATKCDLLIAVGARFSDRVIGKNEHIKNAKVIHIDIDEKEIDKNIKTYEHIVGDAKVVLKKILNLVDEKKNQSWINEIEELKEPDKLDDKQTLTPEYLFEKLNKYRDDLVITTEVGQHQMWAAQKFSFKTPRTLITSGGLGTMGFGLGAAMGAQIGTKEKRVINIAGDGSFAMNNNELATLVSNKIPVIIIVVNNNVLGMVRQWQTLFYGGRYSHTTLNRKTDFVKLGEAQGVKSFRTVNKEEFDKALEYAMNNNEPVLIDYAIDSDKKVFPMVAAGAPISEIITE